jgi:hypothetical protein
MIIVFKIAQYKELSHFITYKWTKSISIVRYTRLLERIDIIISVPLHLNYGLD